MLGRGERCLADALLVKKVLAAYPRRSERQPLEEYWLNATANSADDLVARCDGGIKPSRIEPGGHSHLLSALGDYARVSVRAAEKYHQQTRWDPLVLHELLLQALGAIGLLRFFGKNAGLQEDALKVKIHRDKIVELINAEKIDIDIEPAMADI